MIQGKAGYPECTPTWRIFDLLIDFWLQKRSCVFIIQYLLNELLKRQKRPWHRVVEVCLPPSQSDSWRRNARNWPRMGAVTRQRRPFVKGSHSHAEIRPPTEIEPWYNRQPHLVLLLSQNEACEKRSLDPRHFRFMDSGDVLKHVDCDRLREGLKDDLNDGQKLFQFLWTHEDIIW